MEKTTSGRRLRGTGTESKQVLTGWRDRIKNRRVRCANFSRTRSRHASARREPETFLREIGSPAVIARELRRWLY
jgi:hypothetical protein